MSGWMKYPYKKCPECPYFDWDESDAIVPEPDQDCRYDHDDCPELGSEDDDEDVFV